MPRRPLIQFDGPWHHVFHRGRLHKANFSQGGDARLVGKIAEALNSRLIVDLRPA